MFLTLDESSWKSHRIGVKWIPVTQSIFRSVSFSSFSNSSDATVLDKSIFIDRLVYPWQTEFSYFSYRLGDTIRFVENVERQIEAPRRLSVIETLCFLYIEKWNVEIKDKISFVETLIFDIWRINLKIVKTEMRDSIFHCTYSEQVCTTDFLSYLSNFNMPPLINFPS